MPKHAGAVDSDTNKACITSTPTNSVAKPAVGNPRAWLTSAPVQFNAWQRATGWYPTTAEFLLPMFQLKGLNVKIQVLLLLE